MPELTVSVCLYVSLSLSLNLTRTHTHTQSTLGSPVLNSVFPGLITNAAGAQGSFKWFGGDVQELKTFLIFSKDKI